MSVLPVVSGYRVIEVLGRGGFAVVYRAEQLSLHREVALKVLSVLDLGEDEIVRFERECEALAKLDWHPNVLRILDAGLDDERRPYLSMELMEHGSVESQFAGRPMPHDEVIRLGTEISSALAVAHEIGILHRDVKPANILIDRSVRFRLADFGIASIVGATRSSGVGGMAGTIGFMAPEIILGQKAVPASDVYSLAATMHSLVTGRAPFSKVTDESVAASIARILHEPHPNLRDRGVPDSLAAVIDRAMAKDPADRYANADELSRALAATTVDDDRTVRRGALIVPPTSGDNHDETIRRDRVASTPPITAVPAAAAFGATIEMAEFDDHATIIRAAVGLVVVPEGPRDRTPMVLVAAALVVLLLGVTGVAVALRSSGSDKAVTAAAPSTAAALDATVPPAADQSVDVASTTPGTAVEASTATPSGTGEVAPTTIVETGVTTTVGVIQPVVPTTMSPSRPQAPTTTLIVASQPAPPSGGAPPVVTAPPVTTAPAAVTTAPAPVTTPAPTTTTPPPVTTAPPVTTSPPAAAPTINGFSQSASPTPGQYQIHMSVSPNTCVTVTWSIPSLGRSLTNSAPPGCWPSMYFDTGWNSNELNLPPSGSYSGSVTIVSQATGLRASGNFTLVVP